MAIKTRKKRRKVGPHPYDFGESVPVYSGTTNPYVVEPRVNDDEKLIDTAVQAIPFVGGFISDLFFGDAKREQRIDQAAAAKVDKRRVELDRISPQAAHDLGIEFYDHAFTRERSRIEHAQ